MQKEILDETRERARSGKGAIPEEKLRCIWFYTPIVWDYFLINWLEDEWKMVIPMTMDGYYVAKPIDTSSHDPWDSREVTGLYTYGEAGAWDR